MQKKLIFITSFILLLALCMYIIFHNETFDVPQGRVIVVDTEIEINGVKQNVK